MQEYFKIKLDLRIFTLKNGTIFIRLTIEVRILDKDQILLQFRQLYKSDFGFQVLGNSYYVAPDGIHEGRIDNIVTTIEEEGVSLHFSFEIKRDSGIEFLLGLLEDFSGVREGHRDIKGILLGSLTQEDYPELLHKIHDRRMDYLKISTIDSQAVTTLIEASISDVIWVQDSDGYIILVKKTVDKEAIEGLVSTIQTELFEDCQWLMGVPIKSDVSIYKQGNWLRESVGLLSQFSIRTYVVEIRLLLPYQLISVCPKEAREQLLGEMKKDQDFILDAELSATVEMLFVKELNLTDTAKALFIHRNTLLYRIDKIQKLTGFDLRKFSESFMFKIAWLLSKS